MPCRRDRQRCARCPKLAPTNRFFTRIARVRDDLQAQRHAGAPSLGMVRVSKPNLVVPKWQGRMVRDRGIARRHSMPTGPSLQAAA